jgi:serine/alanine adding enzyme
MNVQVLENIDPATQAEISTFLNTAPVARGACGEHDPRWLLVLQEGLRHRPFAIVARAPDNGPITGYLPLVVVKSLLFGTFVVSLPYINRAGVVSIDDETSDAIIEAAAALTARVNARYMELRHHVQPVVHSCITHNKDEKVRMVLELPRDADALFKAVGPKVRNQIRKGEKAGLAIRWGGSELIEEFYDVFSVNMRDLGTPVYSKKLFRSLLTHFHATAEIAVVSLGGKTVAVALLMHDEIQGYRTTQVPSASSLRDFNHTNANMWMYHQLLLRAMSRGSTEFDFGRSSEGSGTYRFKKQWGATPRPTVWQYHLRHGDLDAVRPDNPKQKKRIEQWRKLPVWLTRLIGPTIVRGIP